MLRMVPNRNLIFSIPGFPQPEYRWMKDGVFISEYSSEHFYKIQNVTKEDTGKYQCYARNTVGVIVSENISLIVARKSLAYTFLLISYFLMRIESWNYMKQVCGHNYFIWLTMAWNNTRFVINRF